MEIVVALIGIWLEGASRAASRQRLGWRGGRSEYLAAGIHALQYTSKLLRAVS
jgi:hypothetical protein